MKRWIAFAAFSLLYPVVCVNFTTASWLTESYAEMIHGGLSVYVFLWAAGRLAPSAQGTEARRAETA